MPTGQHEKEYNCSDCGEQRVGKPRPGSDGSIRCPRCSHNRRCRKYYRTDKGQAQHARGREQRRQSANQWCKDNREKARENERKYRTSPKGRELRKRISRKRYYENIEYYRAKARARMQGIELELIQELMKEQPSCQLCGSQENLTVDHMHPVSRGGDSARRNLQVLCGPCNSFKGNRLFLPEGGMLIGV